VNRFKERYMTGGRLIVRSREVRILVVEILLLKKKKECEREQEEDDTREGYRQKGTRHGAPYKACKAPTPMAPYNPPWQAPLHVYRKGAT
jgi:hypothetical protein